MNKLPIYGAIAAMDSGQNPSMADDHGLCRMAGRQMQCDHLVGCSAARARVDARATAGALQSVAVSCCNEFIGDHAAQNKHQCSVCDADWKPAHIPASADACPTSRLAIVADSAEYPVQVYTNCTLGRCVL